MCRLIDLYPTLASLAEVSKPTDPIEGVDLSSVFANPELPLLQLGLAPREAVFSQYPRCALDNPAEDWTGQDCMTFPRTAIGHMGFSVRSESMRYTECA